MKENDREFIIKMWESGEPISQIIRMLPYPAEIARQYIVDMRKAGVLLLERRSNRAGGWRIINMYKEGITNPYEIAEKLNYSMHTVNDVLSKAKLNRKRPKHNYKKTRIKTYGELSDNTQRIIDLLQEGKDCLEVANIVGCSRQNVFQVKKRLFPDRVRKSPRKSDKGE